MRLQIPVLQKLQKNQFRHLIYIQILKDGGLEVAVKFLLKYQRLQFIKVKIKDQRLFDRATLSDFTTLFYYMRDHNKGRLKQEKTGSSLVTNVRFSFF